MNPTFANPLLLLGRLLLALIFLHESVTLATHYTAAQAYMDQVDMPGFLLVPVIALQLGAGLMLALGFQTRLGALGLGLFCVATAILFHTRFSSQNELLHFEKDLAMAGGMAVLMVQGAGDWSIDGWLRKGKSASV